MNLNQKQIETAIGAGLELLGPKSEISIPAKLNDGVFLLKQFLLSIAQGQIGISAPPSTDTPPKQPGIPDEKARAAARKKRKKK